MSYIDNNLMTNEVIVYRAKLHWAIYIPSIFCGFIGLMSLCGTLSSPSNNNDADVATSMETISSIIIFIAFCSGLSAWINRKTSEFAITNKRVIMKFGFIRRTSLELLLQKIEGVLVNQGILGRILNYGTIIVNGTGGSKDPFPKIAMPMEFRKIVLEQIEKKNTAK